VRVVWTIAWRNAWRHTRRTLLTVSTIALGAALLMTHKGLSDGALQQMIDSAVGLGSGHVLIQQAEYQETGRVERHLTADQVVRAETWLAEARSQVTVDHVVRRAFASGLASSADGAVGVRIIGTDPERERDASRFYQALADGRYLGAEDRSDALLGRGVADRLKAGPGTRVVLMSQAADGELESALVRVAGIVDTGLEALDDTLVIVPLATAQAFLGLDGGYHQIALVLGDESDSGRLAAAGARHLEGMEILAWPEAHPELVGMIRLVGARDLLLYTMILALVAFMVLNTMMMAVLERSREFTLLDALGLTPLRRFFMVMAEASIIGVLALVVGFVIGFGVHHYLATRGIPIAGLFDNDVTIAGTTLDPVLYSRLSPARITQILAAVFGMTLVLALLPARRAGRPAEIARLGRR
jgi:ABC-type lipoprotein release transport system permease subunit